MAEAKARTAVQLLAEAEWRLNGIIATAAELHDYLTQEELQAITSNTITAIKRIKDLKSKPKPRIARRWSHCK